MKSHFLNPPHDAFVWTSNAQVLSINDQWQQVIGHADWVGAENLIIDVDVADIDDYDPSNAAVYVRASSGEAEVRVVNLVGGKAVSSKQVQAVLPISASNGFEWKFVGSGAQTKLCSLKVIGYVAEFDADRFTYGSKISQLDASEEIRKDDLFVISRSSAGGNYDSAGRPVGSRTYDESKSVNLYDLRQSLGLGAFAKIGSGGSQDGPYLNCSVVETTEGEFKVTTTGGLFPEQKAIVLASSSGTNGTLDGGHIEVGDPAYVPTTIGSGPGAISSFNVEVTVKQWGIPFTKHYAVTAAGGDDRKDEWHNGLHDFARMGSAQTYQPTVLCIAILGVPPSE